ncbi:inositol monophosphatase family protein [Saccharothrix coeruleofusca]|uniref:Inositol monophosphatase n=1 Tax=Saccharothrix coeruleofusca TaxID=33919 RepID=A0A918ASU0_9PSEU|nr:inositol monophosphatase [Saccharothrix coeruleofusca]GGP78781.1 inositol monophosphatase [Saccharothrix coeruleofusca]
MAHLEFIDDCLRRAAALARRSADRSAVAVKPDDPNQVVTPADLAISAELVGRITARFPDDSVLDEETGPRRGPSGTTWVLDPLDGSSNYAAGTALYGTMLAVVEHGRVVAAGIALPEFDEVLLAERGGGTHLNGVRVRTPARTELADCLVAHGLDTGPPAELSEDFRRLSWLASRCLGIRMSNSVFDAVQVVKGAYGAFLHRRTRIWDVAAIDCVAREAGGCCTAPDGEPLDFTDPIARAADWYPVRVCADGLQPALTGDGAAGAGVAD